MFIQWLAALCVYLGVHSGGHCSPGGGVRQWLLALHWKLQAMNMCIHFVPHTLPFNLISNLTILRFGIWRKLELLNHLGLEKTAQMGGCLKSSIILQKTDGQWKCSGCTLSIHCTLLRIFKFAWFCPNFPPKLKMKMTHPVNSVLRSLPCRPMTHWDANFWNLIFGAFFCFNLAQIGGTSS